MWSAEGGVRFGARTTRRLTDSRRFSPTGLRVGGRWVPRRYVPQTSDKRREKRTKVVDGAALSAPTGLKNHGMIISMLRMLAGDCRSWRDLLVCIGAY